MSGRKVSAARSKASREPDISHQEVVEKIRETRMGLAKYVKAIELFKNRRTFRNWCGLLRCCSGKQNEDRKDDELIERAIQLSDFEISRFLKLSNYDPEVACDKAVEALLWRRDHGIDTILGSNAEFAAQDRLHSMYWCGVDLKDRPVLVCCLRRHDPHSFSTETTLRYMLWKLEQKLADPSVEEITLLLDLKGSSRQNWDSKVLKLLIPTVYNFYPGKLGLVLYYPNTTLNWIAFKMVAQFLGEDTVKKFVFVDNVEATGVESLLSQFSSLFGSGNQPSVNRQGSMKEMTPEEQEQVSRIGSVASSSESTGSSPADGSPPKSHAKFTDYIAKSHLERRYGGNHVEAHEEIVIQNFMDEEFEVLPNESDEFSKFMESQDERLDSLVKVANTRTTSIGSVGELPIAGTELRDGMRLFGSSTMFCEIEKALEDRSVINAWSPISASRFNVRCGPDYRKHKKKAPSAEAIYDLIAMDLIAVDSKQFHIAPTLQFPPYEKSTKENKSGLPEMLIVNYQAPLYEPVNPLMHKAKSDGKGVGMSAVFKLSDWARENPDDMAVQLFRRYVNCFETDPFRERLKCIASIANPEEMNLTRMEKALFARYNATPWLVRPQYKFHQGHNYFEIDIDIHTFAYFSRKVGWSVTKRLDHAIMDACLVIQSETNEEMPERVLCCWRANRLQLNNAPCK